MNFEAIARPRATVLRALAALALSWCALAGAQSYPSKPIRLIVPFAAGGTADLAARVVADAMGQKLGQPMVIENKPGAGGTLGTALALGLLALVLPRRTRA